MTTTIDGTTGLISNAGVFGDTSGNVGIGTTSPTSKLHVASAAATQNVITMTGSTTAATNLQMTNTGGNFYLGLDNSTGTSFGKDAYSGNLYISGTYPMLFWTSSAERMRIDSSGNVLVTNVAGLGYGTGSGGTVTQATSRTTGVTLSKPTGAITMFSAAGSTTAATFTVTNTLVAATDTIILNQKSGTNLYVLLVTAVVAGSFNITFYTTGGTASDTPVINFSVIKGVTA
jgi:hypothetical protein